MTEELSPAIYLVPGSEIPEDQVNEVMEILSSEGLPVKLSPSVYALFSAEELPPILVLTIVSAVSGFVGAMTKDMWEGLKRALIVKVVPFLKKKWQKNPEIQLQLREKEHRITIFPPTETDALMKEALDKLPAYLKRRPKCGGYLFYNKGSHGWQEHPPY